MNYQRLTIGSAGACWLALTVFMAGCRSSHKVSEAPADAPKYRQMNLVYELNGQFRNMPLADKLSQASFATGPETVKRDRWSLARLAIEYPHPDGSKQMARATLRLSSDAPPPAPPPLIGKLHELGEVFAQKPEAGDLKLSSVQDDEIWVLDFPKQQLDLLLADLSHGGFFEEQFRTQHGTRLEVQMDDGRTDKSWTPEPRLDDFINRVHTEGRLSGFIPRNESLAMSVAKKPVPETKSHRRARERQEAAAEARAKRQTDRARGMVEHADR